MNVILLCAGFGTRLYPLTKNVPKPLLPVAGKPIVEFLVDQLAATDWMSNCLIVSNHHFADQFHAWRDTIAQRLSAVQFSVLDDGSTANDNRLGAVRDLALAVRSCSLSNPTLISAGDNLFDFNLSSFFKDYAEHPRNLILTYQETNLDQQRRTGIAEVGEGGRLVQFHEKPPNPPSGLACPTFYLLQPSALQLVDRFLEESPAADAPGHFLAWLASRQPVFTHQMDGRRLDVGNLKNYQHAEQWIQKACF